MADDIDDSRWGKMIIHCNQCNKFFSSYKKWKGHKCTLDKTFRKIMKENKKTMDILSRS